MVKMFSGKCSFNLPVVDVIRFWARGEFYLMACYESSSNFYRIQLIVLFKIFFDKPFLQFFVNALRNQIRDIAAEICDLSNKGRACEAVLLAGHNENRFDSRDGAVCHRKLKFVLDIGEVSQSSQHCGCSDACGVFDGKAIIALHADAGDVRNEGLNYFDALFESEKLVFDGTVADGDDKLVEKLYASIYNVKMAVGNRVERTGEDGPDKFFSHNIAFR